MTCSKTFSGFFFFFWNFPRNDNGASLITCAINAFRTPIYSFVRACTRLYCVRTVNVRQHGECCVRHVRVKTYSKNVQTANYRVKCVWYFFSYTVSVLDNNDFAIGLRKSREKLERRSECPSAMELKCIWPMIQYFCSVEILQMNWPVSRK